MASTTLITFMLQAPTTVFSVEIWGSWDNFSKPYQLKRDRKTGPGQWRGCHTFENITCDGDILNASTSRDGGLKMGGTYWYYYVLDGDIEYHDPAEPSTNLCPLLPGQIVNVLDVPVQGSVLFAGSRNVSSSSLDSAVFTLDPQDKYLPSGVRRATTTSAVHARKARLPTMTRPMFRALRSGLIGPEALPQTSHTSQNAITLERQHSLLSVFHRMRQTRSAGSNAKSTLGWPRKIFSRAGQSKPSKQQEAPDPVPEMATLHDQELSPSPIRIGDAFELPIQLPSTADYTDRAPTAFIVNLTEAKTNVYPLEQPSSNDRSQLVHPSERDQGLEDGLVTSSARNSETSCMSSYYTPLEQLRENSSYFAPVAVGGSNNDSELDDHFGRLDLAPDAAKILVNPNQIPFDRRDLVSTAVPSAESTRSLELGFHSPEYSYSESLASHAASANFSPCLASNTTYSGPSSPYHLSQPETPVTSEFGDDLLTTFCDSGSLTQTHRRTSSDPDPLIPEHHSAVKPPALLRPPRGDKQTSHAVLSSSQGYSLPDHSHASVPTIQNIPSLSFKSTDSPPFVQDNSKQDLVHSWNDGSAHQMSALGELVDDLGYLGKLII